MKREAAQANGAAEAPPKPHVEIDHPLESPYAIEHEMPASTEPLAIEMDDDSPSDARLIEIAEANLADATDHLLKLEDESELPQSPTHAALISIAASAITANRHLAKITANFDDRLTVHELTTLLGAEKLLRDYADEGHGIEVVHRAVDECVRPLITDAQSRIDGKLPS